jgi:hypothetical protein
VFLSSGPHLPAKVGSGAPTCPMALGSVSPSGELRRCHVFLSFGPHLPAEVGSGAATYPTASSGLWTTGIKKGLAALGTQLGSHVYKTRSYVTEVPVRHVDRPLQFGSTVQHSPS